MNNTILPQYADALSRPQRATIHFNDVFTERPADFDAEITAILRNLGQLPDLTYPIGQNPKSADYGALLLDELLAEERRIVETIRKKTGGAFRHEACGKALLSVVNSAPRNKQTTANGRNGNDFHLAITINGLEVYAVPLERLQALETRHRILALFRIPNERLQVTNGLREQFRSSIITTTRYYPEILEPVFQYPEREALIEAKKQKRHPERIPRQERLAEVAYVDKFGNIRLSVRDGDEFQNAFEKAGLGDKVIIRVGHSAPIKARYVTSLAEIPEGELGLYTNVADAKDKSTTACHWELVKKSEDPNNDPHSAAAILQKANPGFLDAEIRVETA